MRLDVTFTKGKLVNKSQLIDALAARFQGNRKQAAHALESVLDTITREVAKGEKVAITGFGSFEKRVREARFVRNPRTGERIRAKRTAVPKFSAGADLKAVVSGAKAMPKVTLESAAQAAPAAKRTAAAVKKAAKRTVKKATAKKTAAKKTAKKAVKKAAKKAPARKTAAKKTAKKSTARKTAKKAPARKTAAKKTAKKSTAKRAPARKTAAKKTAKRAPARKTAKKTAKKTARKR
jgi:DNA-binding protein HU-beta